MRQQGISNITFLNNSLSFCFGIHCNAWVVVDVVQKSTLYVCFVSRTRVQSRVIIIIDSRRIAIRMWVFLATHSLHSLRRLSNHELFFVNRLSVILLSRVAESNSPFVFWEKDNVNKEDRERRKVVDEKSTLNKLIENGVITD